MGTTIETAATMVARTSSLPQTIVNSRKPRPPQRLSSRIGSYIYYTPAIGKGSFSKVFIGHHINDLPERPTYVAIKRVNALDMKKLSLTRIQREINLLKSLSHPNIVKFYEAFTDIAQNIYIVTEYCNYGSLDRYTGREAPHTRLSEEQIKGFIRQFRDGLQYLLLKNILHRDIKPPNILLHKQGETIVLKIADFGFAKHFESLQDDSLLQTLCGTPMYLAPEIVKTRKSTILSDLWSIGVILYELFFHKTPFKKPKNLLELLHNIEHMRLRFPTAAPISPLAKEMLSNLLQIDPTRRMPWGNFFNDDWFKDQDQGICLGDSSLTALSSYLASPEPTPSSNTWQPGREELYTPPSLPDSLLSSSEDSSLEEKLEDELVANLRRKMRKPSAEADFLQQSSRLYFSPSFLENYIPAATSLPREIRLPLPVKLPIQGTLPRSSLKVSLAISPLVLSSILPPKRPDPPKSQEKPIEKASAWQSPFLGVILAGKYLRSKITGSLSYLSST